MRFLANENFPLPAVQLMRQAGYDIVSIIEKAPSISDSEVMAIANASGQIILTFDSDYGTLIYRDGLSAPAGVVYLRFIPQSPIDPGNRIVALLTKLEIVLAGMFTVITDNHVRQRPLP
ncbi:DUF5615 family PIN-like protein [Nitrosomonas nitrosa]|uniref:DUF5615 family PIN-like protein n=1 Tax=Nitrosomonas nitrosa TaxID=52442 RepID=UPI0023F998F8|nr:DUF5615 family PIN-like protein [Nitrosomonas nitrosa]MCO6433805.1 DUF5615 family PIN-like protein [Nitrosomonas nitrosa]